MSGIEYCHTQAFGTVQIRHGVPWCGSLKTQSQLYNLILHPFALEAPADYLASYTKYTTRGFWYTPLYCITPVCTCHSYSYWLTHLNCAGARPKLANDLKYVTLSMYLQGKKTS